MANALQSAPLSALYRRAGAAAYASEEAEFHRILQEVATKYLEPGASPEECARFCESLRLEELALARACAAGCEKAFAGTADGRRYRTANGGQSWNETK